MQVEKRKWFAYQLCPIDYGWDRTSSFAEAIRTILAHYDEFSGNANNDIMEFLDDWDRAKSLALKAGWDGDFRHQPSVFWLPNSDTCTFDYGFVFKQDHAGWTYIVSPFELSWLGEPEASTLLENVDE